MPRLIQTAPIQFTIRARKFAVLALFAIALGGLPPKQSSAEVTVRGSSIFVDGERFVPRGVSGKVHLSRLPALGANTVRTYGEEGDQVIAEAERLGLKVILGFWLEHPRRGFDYRNRAVVEAQLSQLRRFVERHRSSPALLMWGLGNEIESELSDDSIVWPAIEEAARLVKSLDPRHPTLAVLAETGEDKIRKIRTLAPHIDVIGINSYGDALPSVADRVRAQGWNGPIVVTELGAIGQWQAPKTPWGAAVEPTSSEKAARLRRYLPGLQAEGIGQILFLWGQKQEVTPTWHSLLLPDGAWTEAAEVMAGTWNGRTPGDNRAPRIAELRLDRGIAWTADQRGGAQVTASDPDGDRMRFTWTLLQESKTLGVAGDAEPVPPDVSRHLTVRDSRVEIAALPAGHYRLFVTVRDGRGAAATANAPFETR